jgi:hypothetical protein
MREHSIFIHSEQRAAQSGFCLLGIPLARYQYIKKEEEEGKEFLDNSDPAVV